MHMESKNMEKVKSNLLEDNEATALVVGFMIGVDILSIGNSLANKSMQDAWIVTISGGIYPLALVFLCSYYVKKHPNEDILTLSKRYLGKILGTICNILFMVQFAIYFLESCSGFVNVFITVVTSFLTPIKIFIPAIAVAFYLSHKGIKVLARINKIALYFTLIVAATLTLSLQRGSYLNVLPIGGSGYKSLVQGSVYSCFAYGGIEGIFLIYPFLRNKNKAKVITLKGTFIVMALYTWVSFISIYCLGYKVTSKTIWPALLVTEWVNLPVINSFRFLFLFLWSIVLFKVLANEQYAITYILSNLIKVKDKKVFYWFLFPITLYFCLRMGNEAERKAFINATIVKATLFNIGYISIIGLLIFIKDKWNK